MLWVSFIPFPTELLGDYPQNKLAVSFYGLVNFMMGLAFTFIRIYMWKKPYITDGFSKDDLWVGVRNVLLFGPLPYLAGALIAWFYPPAAFMFYAFVAIYYIFPSSTALKKTAPD